MIEEDDRFVQKDSFEDENIEKPNIKRYVVLILAWVLWTSIFLIIFTPKIKSAIERSGVITLLKNSEIAQAKNETRTVNLAFLTQDGIKLYQSIVSLGHSSKYHDAIEGLLLGPSEEVLKDKAITCINKNTSLIGLTYSRGICYVDLSSAFNEMDERAKAQIEATLKAFPEIEKVVIMKEGKLINEKMV